MCDKLFYYIIKTFHVQRFSVRLRTLKYEEKRFVGKADIKVRFLALWHTRSPISIGQPRGRQ